MNILLVTESASAGVGRHVMDLAAGFAEQSHRVHLLYSPVRSDATFRADLAALRGLRSVTALPMRHAPHPADAWAVCMLRRMVQTHGPFDVVHLHSTKAGFIGRLAGLHTGAAVVYTPHAPITMRLSRNRWAAGCARTLERTLSFFTTAIIAVSACERDHLVSVGIDPKRLFLVPNGIRSTPPADPSRRARLREEFGAAGADVVIGSVARLEPQKRLDLLLQAVASLGPEARARVRLVIAGGGSEELALKQMAHRLRLSAQIAWLGPVPSAQAYLPAFDLFALTSDYEGMPYTLLEAAEAGLPIVTTQVGGAADVVRNGWNGLITGTRDVPALAHDLETIVLDDELRNKMASRALAGRGRHGLDTMIASTLAVYGEALHRRAGATASDVYPVPERMAHL